MLLTGWPRPPDAPAQLHAAAGLFAHLARPARRQAAAGSIGSRLVEALLGQGHEVVGLDNFSGYYEPGVKRANIAASLTDPRFSMVTDDLATVTLDSLLDGVDMVFHLAGQPGVRTSWGAGFATYVRQNLVATQRLLEAVGCRPIPTVAASTSSVYGENDGRPLTDEAPF